MTGSYFRGDAAPVLTPEDEAKFETVTYTYYEQLNGYKVNLVPIVTQLVENTFGPRLAPLVHAAQALAAQAQSSQAQAAPA